MEFCSDFTLHLNQETIVLSRMKQFFQVPLENLPNQKNICILYICNYIVKPYKTTVTESWERVAVGRGGGYDF